MIYLMMFFEFNFCQGKSALIYRTRHPLLNPKVATHWMGSSLHLVSLLVIPMVVHISTFMLKAFSLKCDCQPEPLKT